MERQIMVSSHGLNKLSFAVRRQNDFKFYYPSKSSRKRLERILEKSQPSYVAITESGPLVGYDVPKAVMK